MSTKVNGSAGKASDECYTPPLIYEAVKDWACQEYNIAPETIVRPFFPDGDYEHYKYPKNCTVLDNPPFSKLGRICSFYLEREIKFFLFAPTLTIFGQRRNAMKMNHIICGNEVIYENGTKLTTSFVTSYGDGVIIQTAPELYDRIEAAMEATYGPRKPALPQFQYPDNVVTTAMFKKYASYGVDLKIHKDDCMPIRKLEAQTPLGKEIFGGGLLLSNKAAADRAEAEHIVAEKTAPHIFELSPKEKVLVVKLDEQSQKRN